MSNKPEFISNVHIPGGSSSVSESWARRAAPSPRLDDYCRQWYGPVEGPFKPSRDGAAALKLLESMEAGLRPLGGHYYKLELPAPVEPIRAAGSKIAIARGCLVLIANGFKKEDL